MNEHDVEQLERGDVEPSNGPEQAVVLNWRTTLDFSKAMELGEVRKLLVAARTHMGLLSGPEEVPDDITVETLLELLKEVGLPGGLGVAMEHLEDPVDSTRDVLGLEAY